MSSHYRLNAWITANPDQVEVLQGMEPESEPEEPVPEEKGEPSTSKGKGKER